VICVRTVEGEVRLRNRRSLRNALELDELMTTPKPLYFVRGTVFFLSVPARVGISPHAVRMW
jgi:hypothetical protein